MTDPNKLVSRRTHSTKRERSKTRRIVVGLEPGDVLGFRRREARKGRAMRDKLLGMALAESKKAWNKVYAEADKDCPPRRIYEEAFAASEKARAKFLAEFDYPCCIFDLSVTYYPDALMRERRAKKKKGA